MPEQTKMARAAATRKSKIGRARELREIICAVSAIPVARMIKAAGNADAERAILLEVAKKATEAAALIPPLTTEARQGHAVRNAIGPGSSRANLLASLCRPLPDRNSTEDRN